MVRTTDSNASASAKPRLVVPFLNNEIRTGGHRRLLELCEDLAKEEFDVTVYLNSALAYEPRHFAAVRIECEYVLGKTLSLSSLFTRCLKKHFSGHEEGDTPRVTAIMIHGETHIKAAIWLKRRLNAPLLYAHRSNTVREGLLMLREPMSPGKKLYAAVDLARNRLNELSFSRHADRIVFQSPYDNDDFLARNPRAKGKTGIIRGNIGFPRFKPEQAAKNGSASCKKLLFVGNYGYRKGLRYLVEAVGALVKGGHGEITLDVLGPGKQRERFASRIEKAGLGRNVTLHGRVDNPFAYLETCDLLVVPSVFDSYPDSVLEGLHVGIPVIGSDIGGIPDILGSPELLFPVQDAETLADKLRRITESDEYYRSLRDLCAARVGAFHFDWPAEWAAALREMSDARARADGDVL